MDRLRRVIPAPRMKPYVDACAGTPTDPVTLYRWNAQLSLALFDDLGTVEVAMRSAMADSLSHKYGLHWYRNTALLDDESLNLVQKAWSRNTLAHTRPDTHATVLELAGYLDSDLRDWLNETSQVPPVLAACPLPQANPLNI